MDRRCLKQFLFPTTPKTRREDAEGKKHAREGGKVRGEGRREEKRIDEKREENMRENGRESGKKRNELTMCCFFIIIGCGH